MPQATEADRAWAVAKFGSIDTHPLITWLEQQGLRMTRDWHWLPPEGRAVTDEEMRAVCFLVDEWDFGGFAKPCTCDRPPQPCPRRYALQACRAAAGACE